MFGDHGVPAQNNPAHGIQPGRPGIPLRITPTFILNPIQKFCGILLRKFHARRNVVQNFALLSLINFPFFNSFVPSNSSLYPPPPSPPAPCGRVARTAPPPLCTAGFQKCAMHPPYFQPSAGHLYQVINRTWSLSAIFCTSA